MKTTDKQFAHRPDQMIDPGGWHEAPAPPSGPAPLLDRMAEASIEIRAGALHLIALTLALAGLFFAGRFVVQHWGGIQPLLKPALTVALSLGAIYCFHRAFAPRRD